jgi:hypothetical protein
MKLTKDHRWKQNRVHGMARIHHILRLDLIPVDTPPPAVCTDDLPLRIVATAHEDQYLKTIPHPTFISVTRLLSTCKIRPTYSSVFPRRCTNEE